MKFGKASVVLLTMALTWLSGGVESRPVSTPGKGLSDAKPAAREGNAPAVAPEGPALPTDSTGVAEAAEMPGAENSEDSEEKIEYDVAEEDAGWMENPLFDASLPSFAAAPPRGVSPDGPCSAAEWSAYQRSVRPTLVRKDAGNVNLFMRLYRRSAHQKAYEEAAEDCLKWVSKVRRERADARLEALLQHRYEEFRDQFKGVLSEDSFWSHWNSMRQEIASQYKSEIIAAQEKWEERSRAIWEGRRKAEEDDEEDVKEEEENGQEDGSTADETGSVAAVAGLVLASGGQNKRRRSVSREPKRKKGRKSMGDEDDDDTEYKEEDEEEDDDH